MRRGNRGVGMEGGRRHKGVPVKGNREIIGFHCIQHTCIPQPHLIKDH